MAECQTKVKQGILRSQAPDDQRRTGQHGGTGVKREKLESVSHLGAREHLAAKQILNSSSP